MKKKYGTNLIIMSLLLIVVACKKDSDLPKLPPPINEPELITTVKLIFTDSANTSAVTSFSFIDLDGDGGNQPSVFDTFQLKINCTYFVEIELINNITNTILNSEIAEEKNDHLFVYKPQNVDLNVRITDFDTNTPPLPFGLKSTWRTGAASNGFLQVLLKHQPGIKDGTEAPGETDVDLSFKTIITP